MSVVRPVSAKDCGPLLEEVLGATVEALALWALGLDADVDVDGSLSTNALGGKVEERRLWEEDLRLVNRLRKPANGLRRRSDC